MPILEPSDLSDDSFYATLGHRPGIMKAWAAMDEAMMGEDTTLPPALKENVRRSLSQGVGCEYCASFGPPPPEGHDRRESLALAYVQLIAEDPTAIDDSTFEVLREDFTDEEILELTAWICFKLGANVLGAALKLEPSNPEQRQTYETWLEGRERAMSD